MEIFEFGTTGFWDPYIRWGGGVQLVVIFFNLYYLYRYIKNHHYTKLKTNVFQDCLENPNTEVSLDNFFKKEYRSNLKYSILLKITSKSILKTLRDSKYYRYAKLIEISKAPESIIEMYIEKKNYGILVLCFISLLAFALFVILVSLFCLPDRLSNIVLTNFHIYLAGPFQLFLLTTANFFLSVFTYVQTQKFAKTISLNVRYLEAIVVARQNKESDKSDE